MTEQNCKHRWVDEQDSVTHCDLCGIFLDILEATAPQKRMPGSLNPDDFATPEQFEKAKGPSIAVGESMAKV